jgi:hypothetical protein
MSTVDLSRPPIDPVAAKNYEPLHSLWKDNNDAFAERRDFNPTLFAEWRLKYKAFLNCWRPKLLRVCIRF